MERTGAASIDGSVPSRSATSAAEPDYSSSAVQGTLEHLASIDLIELCNEAKVECCRATRDLRSCGRYVRHVLKSCGHASLCAECSQRCDFCPICRVPIPRSGNKLQLRLYYECIEAGLISKRCDDRSQENEDRAEQLHADVQRLYSFFDVAMENNLVSLICHYVTDVCMDESAVSSDPVTAIMLDEVVVKDWCKRTFRNIITELRGIYNLDTKEMENSLSLLLKFSGQLAGLSTVLEVLESSVRGTLSARLEDLHYLQESILKTKQHVEIMIWCIRHQFLENVKSRYANISEWRSNCRERKSAAVRRSWPSTDLSIESSGHDGSLFIEDALVNLDIEHGYTKQLGEGEIDIESLQRNGNSPFFRSKIDGQTGCYPFENLRAAADILFLHGSSDVVLAKKAIFLYYLFDRHWTIPDEKWRYIVDDFAMTFSITRHSLLESFIFYLLDDSTDGALQEACHLLPEISGQGTHPKVPQVLLERQLPDMALMVLRWAGRDGGLQLGSLGEAVTTVRVRVECGLVTEAFTYQRILCTKVKESKLKRGLSEDAFDESKGDFKSWLVWVETLVTEICCLCIRRNLVDRMIELPWNSDEEKYLHKCLLDCAVDGSATNIGSLLVVYYLQRYRYAEAYQVDLKLRTLEEECKAKKSVSESILARMESTSHWRMMLIDKCVSLLPEVQQQQLKMGRLAENALSSSEGGDVYARSDLSETQEMQATSLLIPSNTVSPLVLRNTSDSGVPKAASFRTPTRPSQLVSGNRIELNDTGPASIVQERLFSSAEQGSGLQFSSRNNTKFDSISTPKIHRVSPSGAMSVKEVNRSSSRVHLNRQFRDNQSGKSLPEVEQNGLFNQFRSSSPPYSRRITANPVTMTPMSMQRDAAFSEDPVEVPCSFRNEENGITNDDSKVSVWPRWRSDETSDEEDQSPDRAVGLASYSTGTRRIRRSRFARR